MFEITFNDFGSLKALEQGELASKNLKPAMDDIAGELLARSDDAFVNLADPSTGAAWPELAPATIKQRSRLGYSPAEILQRTGRLKGSVATETDSHSVDVGANVEYALVHFRGGTPVQNIPARPFVGASQDDLASFEQIISDFILKEMR